MKPIITSRLMLDELSINEASFILELLNTEGWKQFIGERNVHDLAAATAYIQKIIENQDVTYYVVKLLPEKTPIGLLTIIKRAYLPHHDLGFAFLPAHSGKGYAFEGASALLHNTEIQAAHSKILAICLKENVRSIRLLEKLGMVFDKVIVNEEETLMSYGLTLNSAS